MFPLDGYTKIGFVGLIIGVNFWKNSIVEHESSIDAFQIKRSAHFDQMRVHRTNTLVRVTVILIRV